MNCFWKDLDTEVASRVVKAMAAAAQAVSCCDGARLHAIEVVAAGNDAVAGEAAVGCTSASSAALEVAALCEAVAREADANYLAAATLAAQQARAAAARCDVEGGAAAATQAANACADSCVAACADAAARSLAAREAAARCVVARGDLATARCVGRKTATLRELLTPVRYRYREFADVHKEARKDAATAALAAERATLRCVAARRRAVSAASIARKAASRCEAAGGDGAVAAAKAREAADRCVAARSGDEADGGAHVSEASEAEAGAIIVTEAAAAANVAARPDPVVPLADAAALEARKAAASCDKALADPTTDKEFLYKMRGWLMTVATLFVSIAFQAITQPPPGMSFEQCGRATGAKDATSPTPAPAPLLANSYGDAACVYLFLNTITMATALTLLFLMMNMSKNLPQGVLLCINTMLGYLSFTVAGSYIMGTSRDQGARLLYSSYFALFPALVLAFLFIATWIDIYGNNV